ncbi:hypothetical protein AAFF_G00137000 [Aldrovandia affinis]|uniref:Transmembrane protein 254 n=1 Tax=Aldrovandia affinis TaxID=143900 RepID=A0AAD7TBN1_9TELE|nr:hypothetical protein AAFF_G00137000 [Aldrovandia affinis]
MGCWRSVYVSGVGAPLKVKAEHFRRDLCVDAFAVFWPEQLPMEKLGLLGSLSKYLLEHHYPVLYNGWWLAWLVHVFEALYSMKVCSDKGVDSLTARGLWFLQTFLFGFASLNLLLKYRPDPRPKRH